jgi:hypothetical protein
VAVSAGALIKNIYGGVLISQWSAGFSPLHAINVLGIEAA